MNGVGSKRAKIVLVGEAPGEQEDLKGIPFVGRAGKFLDSVLLSVGLKRREVFITNVVRCRPPDNRRPTDDEIISCLPHLISEMKVIRPRVVLAMGAVALKALTGSTEKMSGLVGKRIDVRIDGVSLAVVPCYHPSAAMRNRKMRESFKSALLAAIAIAS